MYTDWCVRHSCFHVHQMHVALLFLSKLNATLLLLLAASRGRSGTLCMFNGS